MAAIDPWSSARYFLDYSVSGHDHTLMMRTDSTVVDSDAIAVLSDFLTLHHDFIYELTVTGLRFAQAGEHNTNDVAWTGDTVYGDGTGPEYTTAWYYDYVGRDAGGIRLRVALFGANQVQMGNNYRITPIEAAFVSDALASLTQDAQMWLTVNNMNPVWKQYANCGVNAYWRNKVR